MSETAACARSARWWNGGRRRGSQAGQMKMDGEDCSGSQRACGIRCRVPWSSGYQPGRSAVGFSWIAEALAVLGLAEAAGTRAGTERLNAHQGGVVVFEQWAGSGSWSRPGTASIMATVESSRSRSAWTGELGLDPHPACDASPAGVGRMALARVARIQPTPPPVAL